MPSAVCFGMVLFAQNAPAVPTWTDKEILIAVGSTIVALLPVALLAIRLVTHGYRKQVKKAEAEGARLKVALDAAQGNTGPLKTSLADMEQLLQHAQLEVALISAANAAAQHKGQTQTLTIGKLEGDLHTFAENLTKHQEELAAERRRISRALRKDGQTWTERVLASAPEFKPLDPDGRRTPIISVLNLKGGIGNRTLHSAANR